MKGNFFSGIGRDQPEHASSQIDAGNPAGRVRLLNETGATGLAKDAHEAMRLGIEFDEFMRRQLDTHRYAYEVARVCFGDRSCKCPDETLARAASTPAGETARDAVIHQVSKEQFIALIRNQVRDAYRLVEFILFTEIHKQNTMNAIRSGIVPEEDENELRIYHQELDGNILAYSVFPKESTT